MDFQQFLKSKFGFSNILADSATNFEYILSSEIENKEDLQIPQPLTISDGQVSKDYDFFIIKHKNDSRTYFCNESCIVLCLLKDYEKYNWHTFGFFVEDFNDLLGKANNES